MEITYTTKVLNFPGMTVKVSQPVLTDKERERRMEQIKKAVADLMR